MSEQELAVFDEPAALRAVDHDEGLLREVIQLLLDDAPDQLERIVQEDDLTLVLHAAHRLRGAAVHVGGLRFADLLTRVELAARAGDLAAVQALQPRVRPHWEALAAGLRAWSAR